jgi:succinate dehydrogenase / fumarate reductase cytochrome b subunit
MNWIKFYTKSSIGRKQLVAVTGLMLCAFLLLHLIGNFTLFAGYEVVDGVVQCAFNDYAAKLTAIPPLLILAEIGLFSVFFIHITTALRLAYENIVARGEIGYAVNAKAGSMTVASTTMPYTGIWILVFMILHIINFKFSDHSGEFGLYGIVANAFQNPIIVGYYIITFFLLGMHLFHGLESFFQTMGLNNPKYNGIYSAIAMIYAVVIFVGYSSIPVWFLFFKGGVE